MATSILNSAQAQDENSWKEVFLTLCKDVCGQGRDKLPPEDEAYSCETCCPFCGNPVMGRRAEGRMEWTDCETCRHRSVIRVDQLRTLVRSTQENARHLLGIEIESELNARRELRIKGRHTVDEAFRIDTVQGEQKGKKKHEAVLINRLPDAVIAANVVRYLCSIFLEQNAETLCCPGGLAEWFAAHYLFLIDRKDYARILRKADELEEDYQFWAKKLGSPLSTRIIHMSRIMNLAREEKEREELGTSQESTSQEISEQAGGASDQGGQTEE